MIEVDQLSVRFNAAAAVQNVSFAVGRGELIGLLGPNGAGKTTCLRVLAGVLWPTSGQVAIAGYDALKNPQKMRSQVGYLPEAGQLYPEMRVNEYLRYRARMKSVPRRLRGERVEHSLNSCDLKEVQFQLIGRLSRGFRQRVGLADALLGQPPVLLLDEPTAGLDPSQLDRFRTLMVDLSRDRTVIISSHQLAEVDALCARVLIVNQSRLVYDGAIRSVDFDWYVRVRGPDPQELIAALEPLGPTSLVSLPEPDRDRVDGTGASPSGSLVSVRVRSESGGEAISEIVHRRGWVVSELRPTRRSLEDLFGALTRDDDDRHSKKAKFLP